MLFSNYIVLTNTDVRTLESVVNEFLKRGYVPVGGFSVVLDTHSDPAEFCFCQAVAKPE